VILVDHLCVVEQSTNQRTFAIVDAAARQQTEQFLAFMLRKVSVDV